MSSGVASKAYNAGFASHMVQVTAPGEPHAPTIDAKDMGKCPGDKRRDGSWFPKAVSASLCDTMQEAERWDRNGANVGLALGRKNNLIAVDNDIDDPVAAGAVNIILQTHFPHWRGVDSPGHVRFLYPVRIKGTCPKGSTLVFKKGDVLIKIDILSDGKQFVSWGVHPRTMKPYVWNTDLFDFMDGVLEFVEIEFEELQEIIQEITQALGALGWERASGAVSANSDTATAGSDTNNSKRVCTEYELGRWLALIPNSDKDTQFEDRNKWVALAHAIRGASEGADWGREAWIVWCDQRPQTPGEPEKVWDTIKGEDRLGLDFIRECARERNAKLAAQLDFELAPRIDDEEINAIAASAAGFLWPHILPRYVWVAGQDSFYDLVNGEKFSRMGLDMKLGHLADTLQNEAFQNVKKKMSFSQMFSEHPDTLKADNFIYWPGQPRIVQDANQRLLVNSWRAADFTYRPNVTKKDIQQWLDHVEIVCGNKADAERLIKYFAFVVKRPGDKANHHPLVSTKPGGGKDNMLKPVIVGVGPRNVREVTADNLSGQWTDFLENKLVFVSETRQHARGNKSSHDVMNDIKPFLVDTPATVGVHRKGRDIYQIPNLSHWVFFSNEAHPLYLAEGDRRIWVINNLAADPPPPAYFEKLVPWLDRNSHLVASFLRDYPLTAKDIAEFKGVAPMNTAKQELIAANRDPLDNAVREIIEDAKQGQVFPMLIVTLEDVRAEVQSREPKLQPTSPMIARHLRKYGARPAYVDSTGTPGPTALPGGGQKRFWILADKDTMGRDYTKLGQKDIAALWTDKKWPQNTPYHTSTGVPLTAVSGVDDI